MASILFGFFIVML